QMRSDARRNRERLLAAAMSAFTEHGADDTSLEEIARRAGVGIGTLYRHFPTRQSLLESVYRDQVEALCERARSLREQASPGEAIIAWLRALVAFSLSKRNLISGLVGGSAKDGAAKDGAAGKDSPLFSACRSEINEAAGSLLARAKEAGQIRPDIEVSDLLRLSHGVVAATDRLPDQASEAERLLDLMLGGIWQHQPQL
ncbi:MAG TPA: TetR/AcrR family transcriptional regulator, partial [Streptosporangiaceae bacterium]